MKLPKHWILVSLVFIAIRLPLFAQETHDYAFASANRNPAVKLSYPDNPSLTTVNNKDELKVLADLENSFNKKPDRKLLLSFLRQLNSSANPVDKQSGSKLYLHLANLFARLRLYPLVMKCYFKTTSPDDDVYRNGYFIRQNNSLDTAGLLAINSRDSLLLKTDSGLYNHNGGEIQSIPVHTADITNPFDDGKVAVKYALLVHIQQPKPGKPKIFVKLGKVGHTFITLVKYNTDSTYVARTFGFYPKKDHFLSATPLFPSSSPEFKNDEKHDWDEVVGKFISKRRFQKILLLVKQYDSRQYNLNSNNCTDFGLNVAVIGGINILDTYGKWPLGSGNNPASTGQSVLQGKVLNTDTEDTDKLFIYNDLMVNK